MCVENCHKPNTYVVRVRSLGWMRAREWKTKEYITLIVRLCMSSAWANTNSEKTRQKWRSGNNWEIRKRKEGGKRRRWGREETTKQPRRVSDGWKAVSGCKVEAGRKEGGWALERRRWWNFQALSTWDQIFPRNQEKFGFRWGSWQVTLLAVKNKAWLLSWGRSEWLGLVNNIGEEAAEGTLRRNKGMCGEVRKKMEGKVKGFS